jgi:hypothetical protein
MESAGLPGEELVLQGCEDLERRARTPAALLVSLAAPRLQRLGIRVADPFPDPEAGLFGLLAAEEPGSAHSRYNALVRRLVSFEHAAECAS